MCQHCEENSYCELKPYVDPDYEQAGIIIRAYLQQYDGAGWAMTTSNGDYAIEVGVTNCPWCGRELD